MNGMIITYVRGHHDQRTLEILDGDICTPLRIMRDGTPYRAVQNPQLHMPICPQCVFNNWKGRSCAPGPRCRADETVYILDRKGNIELVGKTTGDYYWVYDLDIQRIPVVEVEI